MTGRDWGNHKRKVQCFWTRPSSRKTSTTQKARAWIGTLPGRQCPAASMPREERHNQPTEWAGQPEGNEHILNLLPFTWPHDAFFAPPNPARVKGEVLIWSIWSTSQGTEQGGNSSQRMWKDKGGLLSKDNLSVFNMLLHECTKEALGDSIIKLDLLCNFFFFWFFFKGLLGPVIKGNHFGKLWSVEWSLSFLHCSRFF